MKLVILAGGLGTRLREETTISPKPMLQIGGKPILWHIMKIYSAHGINDFIICGGYKSYVIKEYFSNYFLHMTDVTFHLSSNQMEVHHNTAEPWRVTVVDTGEKTMTGGRLKRVAKYLDGDFCFTYGDGLGDVDISKLIALHHKERKLATITAVQPPGRFGSLKCKGNSVFSFDEKPKDGGSWVNAGFSVLSPKVLDYIEDDATIWERTPVKKLVEKGEVVAFHHTGFWQPMDTLRDKIYLEELWNSGKAKWKVWK